MPLSNVLQSPYRNRESQLLPETLGDMEVMYMNSALQVMNMDQTAAEWAARIAGAETEIHNGADVATVEAVLRILKSC